MGALAVGSGQAAQFIAIASLLGQGDEIVAASTLYGGTYTQFDISLRRLGIVAVSGRTLTVAAPDRLGRRRGA